MQGKKGEILGYRPRKYRKHEEYDVSGNLLRKYVYGPGIDEPSLHD